jgi:hypothetical protein
VSSPKWYWLSSGTDAWLIPEANFALTWRPYSKFLLLIKMTEWDIFVIHADNDRPRCSKTVLQFWITISYPEHLILLFGKIQPLDLWLSRYLNGVLQGRSFDETDELLSAIQEIIRWVDDRSTIGRRWDFGCGISRMDDPIAKLYWWK